MPARLSKKAWNNVLIFASLAMILVFNATQTQWLNSADNPQDWPLLPDASMVLTLDYPNARLERTGPTWRVQSELQIPPAQIDNLVQQWQGSRISGLSRDEWTVLVTGSDAPLAIVRVTLAAQSDPLTLVFYQLPDRLLIQRGELYGSLPLASKGFLLPVTLIASPSDA